jgi:hypothetical protein
MVSTKINNKGEATFTNIFLSIIIVMALFYGLFGWVASNYN